jgi:hypothetical protein
VQPKPVDPRSEDPIGEIFERAVTPFETAGALRSAIGADTPVIRMRPDPNPGEGTAEEFEGGTIRAPVLDALRDATVLGWDRASAFEFESLGAQEVALVYEDAEGGKGRLRVVTRGQGDAYLVADIDQMIEDLAALVEHPAVGEAIPWAGELFGSLARGIRHARDKFVEDLHKPGPEGAPSLADEFQRRDRPTGP